MTDDLALTHDPDDSSHAAEDESRPNTKFDCKRTELMELLRDPDTRRRYIDEFIQGDLETLLMWFQDTNRPKRQGPKANRIHRP